MNPCWEDVFHRDIGDWEERYRWELNQDHLVFKRRRKDIREDYQQLLTLCQRLRKKSAYLVTIVGSDENRLEDECFKIYYVFSHDVTDHFLILEYPLCEYVLPEHPFSRHLLEGRAYPSIRKVFAAAIPFEREIFDLFDLAVVDIEAPVDFLAETASSGFLLHESYPPYLAPLEVGKPVEAIGKKVQTTAPIGEFDSKKPGEVLLPVGPIHAGIIEAGRFSFHIAGEVVDDVDIQLGFKHKGIEKLFQTKFSILDGWQLAERISGDSSFSHSLAYCYAVEALARIDVSLKATWLRGLFLELERLYNHVADSAALAQDVAFNLISSEIAVLREYLVRLNAELTGHRFLRGVNRPGGIEFPPDMKKTVNSQAIDGIIHKISRKRFGKLADLVEEFRELGELLLRTPGFRERMLNTGTLRMQQAHEIGATGLIARASGIRQRDFRGNHPSGIYKVEPKLQSMVKLPIPPVESTQEPQRPRTSGDVFSRLDVRLYEVDTSMEVIKYILESLEITQDDVLVEPHIGEAVRRAENFEFALGYVEGWRGDIVYWVMKDRFNKIFRCKVRDPSFLNWPALRLAVIPDDPNQPDATGNILPDFPIINKSFNLSYSGHDL